MGNDKHKTIWVDHELVEAIEDFPLTREVEHCNAKFFVDAFEIYATCPKCEVEIKLRSYSASYEIEDVFDAVFLWLNRPGALEVVKRRQKRINEIESEDARAS
jgi:hypothetical protein